MTTLEMWAEEWVTKFAKQTPGMLDFTEAKKCFMAGYRLCSQHRNTPPTPCPVGCRCPDCGPSLIDDSITD